MIKVLFLFSVFVAGRAVPIGSDVQILRNEFNIAENGNYKFAYELSDQQKREEQGEVIPIDPETSVLSVRGSYSYVGPDGITYSVSYIADDNGFQAYGDHIPTPPPPPPPPGVQFIPQKALLSLVG